MEKADLPRKKAHSFIFNRFRLPSGTAVLLLVCSSLLHAGGKADEFAFESVSGNSHWTYTIDLDELDEGKHNLVIRSVDEAGNVRLEGPFDFNVDPETDIPIAVVAHPRPGDRVGRMLPIIGTARDDDGISRVEVSINGGPWRPASGTEAWSAVLDAGALGDGPHIMTVKAFDLNGLESTLSETPFIVDTSAPIGGVTDPVSGALISGKTEFSGTLEDPNGVESLELSRDGGDTWDSVRLSRNKDTGSADFTIGLDSRDIDDGPVVWWFRGTDTQGSRSDVPFLFFVDNQGPVVSLELPLKGENGIEPVPGNVFLAGTASDLSGVKSLQILAGKNDPVDIPLIPGNPWWTWPLILSGLKDKQVDIIIQAADGAGNVSVEKIRIPLNPDADKPTLSVDQLEEIFGKVFPSGSAFFTGVFSDDDGAGTISWKAGDQEGFLEGVERSWRLDLPDLPVGDLEIELTPEDRHGIQGESVTLECRISPDTPIISLDSITDSSSDLTADWTPGAIISSSGGTIRGTVISDAGKNISLSYLLAGGEESQLSLKQDPEEPSSYSFVIPVRKGAESGSRNFILRAADIYGGESVLGSGFYIQAAPDEAGNVSDPRTGDDKVNLPLPFLRERDGAAILKEGQPLQGWTSGASASGAVLEPESPLLRLRTEGTSFTIESVEPGLSETLRVVFSDGSASRDILILTDHDPPAWEISGPEFGAWSSGALTVTGTISDEGGLASASWALDGRPFTQFEFEETDKRRYDFNLDADFSGQPDGPKILVLRAEDNAGNSSDFRFPFVLDTTAPTLSMVLPSENLPVGAKSTVVYRVPGDEFLDEVSITVDGVGREFADDASLYALGLNLAGLSELPETLSVRAIDRAGNSTEQIPGILYDPVSDKPETLIQTPGDLSVVRGPTDIAGLIVDDDAIASVFWRINGENWNKLPGDASFRVPLPIELLADGAHFLEVYAEDTAGNVGEPDSAWFEITRREAEVELKTPEIGVTNRGITEITGIAGDANGIAEVWISFDNGHTYFLAEGATDFSAAAEKLPDDETPDDETPDDETPDGENTDEAELPESEESTDTESAIEPVTSPGPVIRDEIVEWRYAMDTGVLNDGVHTLLVKVLDGAGDQALLAGLLEVDNTVPILAVGEPGEGTIHTGSMVLEGRVKDSGGLESFYAVIERGGEVLLEYNELVDGVFHIPFDFSEIEAGEALLRVEAADSAGNRAAVSRSFQIEPGRRTVAGNIILPVEGGKEGPHFSLSGFVENAVESDTAYLLINGIESAALEMDTRGRFVRAFAPGDLEDGENIFQVDIVSEKGERSIGVPRRFSYRSSGPWVTLEGVHPGMTIGERPLIRGEAGYYIGAPPEEDKDAFKEYQKTVKDNRPERVEVSLDGGLSFAKAKGTDEWEFRIETGRMGEGDLPILVRAGFPDGWVYTRTLLRLDKTLPDLKLNETIADGSFNGELVLSGTASDDEVLEEVSVSVRPGSQNRYEVPSFVQGLYFDTSFFGATVFNAGLGITFFDDNVKLEFTVGYAPEEVSVSGSKEPARVYGTAVGATLLANVVYLPLGYFWGPNWDRLSFSLAIGANFTYFTTFGDGGGGIMSSVVMQMEIPKVTFPDRTFLTYLAPYIEGQLWFFSSDVNTTPTFRASIGLRLGLL